MNDDRQAVWAAAEQAVRDVLGIEPTEEALLERVGRQLPEEEVAAIVAAVERARRRNYALAAVAASSLAMDHLGAGWWFEERKGTNVFGPLDDPSPSAYVRSGADIERLASWAADDVAVLLWGPAAAYIDLNDPRAAEIYVVPPGTRPGDRLLLWFDPGSLVYAIAEETGVRLDGNVFFSPTERIWGDWLGATNPERIA
ncbi:hypothetical protein [Actinocrispum sp. NPDC049592]|uniref:hypothetical protein n=1 Tax=Actinocrispum sp. NPDC049592 TaxID=3154835 RepID=UPI0034263D1C